MWLTDLLATFHVLFAISWLGGGIMFGFIIAPRLGLMAPPAAREFFIRVVPTVLRFFIVVPTLTVIFGFLLLYNLIGGDWSMLSPSTSWGFDISLGMTFALAALVVGEAGASPALHRLVGLFESLGSPGGATPESIPPAINRARNFATLSIALLLITMVFMVGAGFY
ncbi:MAG TPA: hypothetical protein VEY07_04705 [Thermoplasmata archaeon]|nr:hypothetical protein [Thermoplasmata archaeon]